MNVKFFGYALARQLASQLPARDDLSPMGTGLGCKPSTQADMESDWVAYWCGQLQIPVIFHRKLWEFAYVLQVLFEHGKLVSDAHGLGFGCGEEPIPSYLASRGLRVTMTDQEPAKGTSAGWSRHHQHASTLEHSLQSHLVSRETFDERVALRFVDMNRIPPDLIDYDFCWSICALEHLGTLDNGLAFVEASLRTLKPGGVSVHTTEFNYQGKDTLESGWTVLYQQHHLEALAARLRAQGHTVLPLDFNVGAKPLDMFVDVPPYPHQWSDEIRAAWSDAAHLKLLVGGYPCTCFGLAVIKG